MKAKELGDSIGVHHLKIGKTRKRLFPDSEGEITDPEAKAIRDYLVEATGPVMEFVRVVHASPKFPQFADAVTQGGDKILVQVPHGYNTQRFVGKEIYVSKQKYGDDQTLYKYDPWYDPKQ